MRRVLLFGVYATVAHSFERDACYHRDVQLRAGSPPPLLVIRQADQFNHAMLLPSPADFSITSWRDQALSTGAFYHPHEQPTLMMASLSESSVFIDVGANIGLLTLAVGKMSQNHRVLAFEPVPSMVNVLCASKRLLSLRHVEFFAGAASDTDGNTTVFIPKGRADNTAFTRSAAIRNVQYEGVSDAYEVAIETMRLDRVLEARSIHRVALLKIDTQGHELFVLRGARESIRTKRVQAIYAENDPGLTRDQGVNPDDITTLMHSLGWKLYSASDYVVDRGTFRPRPGALPLTSLEAGGPDVLWLPD